MKKLQKEYKFNWVYEDEKLTINAQKSIKGIKNDPHAGEALETLLATIKSFLEDLEELKKKEQMVVLFMNSDIRAIFNWQFKIIDFLAP